MSSSQLSQSDTKTLDFKTYIINICSLLELLQVLSYLSSVNLSVQLKKRGFIKPSLLKKVMHHWN